MTRLYYHDLTFTFAPRFRRVHLRFAVANVSAPSVELSLYFDELPALPNLDALRGATIFTAPNPHHPAINVHIPAARTIANACDTVINELRNNASRIDCDNLLIQFLINTYDENVDDTAVSIDD